MGSSFVQQQSKSPTRVARLKPEGNPCSGLKVLKTTSTYISLYNDLEILFLKCFFHLPRKGVGRSSENLGSVVVLNKILCEYKRR